jgi:hypothetical protein
VKCEFHSLVLLMVADLVADFACFIGISPWQHIKLAQATYVSVSLIIFDQPALALRNILTSTRPCCRNVNSTLSSLVKHKCTYRSH